MSDMQFEGFRGNEMRHGLPIFHPKHSAMPADIRGGSGPTGPPTPDDNRGPQQFPSLGGTPQKPSLPSPDYEIDANGTPFNASAPSPGSPSTPRVTAGRA